MKFEIGDRVRLNPETTQGFGYCDFRDKDAVIINAWPHIDLYEISIGDKPISTGVKSNDLVMVEPYDPKTAFLSELKDLLARYGAELGDGGTYKVAGMEVTFDNGERIRYKHSTINADNIMDYEEE